MPTFTGIESDFINALADRNGQATQAFAEALFIRQNRDLYADAFNVGGRFWFVERWLKRPALAAALTTFSPMVSDVEAAAAFVANENWCLVGSGASADDVTFASDGSLKLETDGGGTNAVILARHSGTNVSVLGAVDFLTEKRPFFEVQIKTGSSVANVVLHCGLMLTSDPTVGADNDRIYFRYQDGVSSGFWTAETSIGGTDATTSSGSTSGIVAVAADTAYRLRIVVGRDRVARFYLDGTLVATSAALTNAVALLPFIGITETSASARHCYVRPCTLSRDY